MVDWLFLPQILGPVVGTYEGLLRLCELGGGSIFRWWGHLTTIVLIELVLAAGGGDPKT